MAQGEIGGSGRQELNDRLVQLRQDFARTSQRMKGDIEIATLLKQHPRLHDLSESATLLMNPQEQLEFAQLLRDNVEFPLSRDWAEQLLTVAQQETEIQAQLTRLPTQGMS